MFEAIDQSLYEQAVENAQSERDERAISRYEDRMNDY